MRRTYETRRYDFNNWFATVKHVPDRIVLHRQGNPGAKALNALEWGNRTEAFTIHSYIGGKVCYDAIPADRHAFHVKEWRQAQRRGYQHDGQYGKRGDYRAIGIETEDVKGGAPGQAYSLTQDTRITLLLRVAEYCQQWNLGPDDVDEHAAYDPWTRKEDLGDALYLPDFRLDLADLLAGREPWRTVQQFATGSPAPDAWKPVEVARPKPLRPTDVSAWTHAWMKPTENPRYEGEFERHEIVVPRRK